MSRTSMPIRVISVLLAFVLTCTMVPATSLAYALPASDDEESSVVAEGDDVQAEETSPMEDSTEVQPEDNPKTNDFSNNRINEDAVLDTSNVKESSAKQEESDSAVESSASPKEETFKTDVSEMEFVSAAVDLKSQESEAAVMSYNGLTYVVNNSEANTVTMTGWASDAPKGMLSVPSQVINGSKTYTVNKIIPSNSYTGNSRTDKSEESNGDNSDDPDPDPYKNELFVDTDKAQDVTGISIPATVNEIDLAFFQLLPNAKSIAVAEGNETYSSFNGMLLTSDLASLLLVPEG